MFYSPIRLALGVLVSCCKGFGELFAELPRIAGFLGRFLGLRVPRAFSELGFPGALGARVPRGGSLKKISLRASRAEVMKKMLASPGGSRR